MNLPAAVLLANAMLRNSGYRECPESKRFCGDCSGVPCKLQKGEFSGLSSLVKEACAIDLAERLKIAAGGGEGK